MKSKIEQMLDEGWVLATDDYLEDGERYELYVEADPNVPSSRGGTLPKVRCVFEDGKVWLMPPRHTRTGFLVGGSRRMFVRQLYGLNMRRMGAEL